MSEQHDITRIQTVKIEEEDFEKWLQTKGHDKEMYSVKTGACPLYYYLKDNDYRILHVDGLTASFVEYDSKYKGDFIVVYLLPEWARKFTQYLDVEYGEQEVTIERTSQGIQEIIYRMPKRVSVEDCFKILSYWKEGIV